MLFNWSDEYSVQVAEIDGQHRQLVRMINELFDAMQEGKGKAAVGRIIDGLILYTQTHFAIEERYFDQFHYADSLPHKQEHTDFVTKVSQFQRDYTEGRLGLSIHILNFLADWLKNHIKGFDKRFGPVFNRHGIQ